MGTPQTAPRTARRVPFDDGAWDDMQELVIDAYRQTGRWRNWTPDRVDGFIRGRLDDELLGRWTDWRDDIGLWRELGGRLVAAIHPEGPDEAYLDVAPGWEDLQPEMLAWSESRWFERHRADDGPPPLITYAAPDDRLRAEVLVRRGYRDLGPREILRVRALAGDLPEPVTAAGYRVRRADMGDPRDREGLIGITRAVFGVEFDDTAIALEARMRTVHEYLLAEAPDGTWAGWCGVWSVPEVGCGQFEPVGVHPHHRRLGLASAIMTAGMAWMRERGLDRAFVGTGYHAEANRLYQSLGFEPAEVLHQWSLRRTVD